MANLVVLHVFLYGEEQNNNLDFLRSSLFLSVIILMTGFVSFSFVVTMFLKRRRKKERSKEKVLRLLLLMPLSFLSHRCDKKEKRKCVESFV